MWNECNVTDAMTVRARMENQNATTYYFTIQLTINVHDLVLLTLRFSSKYKSGVATVRTHSAHYQSTKNTHKSAQVS